MDQKVCQMDRVQTLIPSPYEGILSLLKQLCFSTKVTLHQFRCVQLPFGKVEIRSSLFLQQCELLLYSLLSQSDHQIKSRLPYSLA